MSDHDGHSYHKLLQKKHARAYSVWKLRKEQRTSTENLKCFLWSLLKTLELLARRGPGATLCMLFTDAQIYRCTDYF